MNRAIKMRLYPNDDQKIQFNKTFGCCRKAWNLMLADAIENHKTNGKFTINTPASYKDKYDYLKEIDSLALSNVWLNLKQAFKNHFDKKRKRKNKFPKFKSKKHTKRSYTTNNQKGTIEIFDNKIKLPKIGFVNAKVHRKPETDWILKSATISQDTDETWYVSLLFEFEKEIIMKTDIDTNKVIGIDYKSNGLFVDNNGNKPEDYKFYRRNHKKLAKEQRKLSRKVGNKKKEIKSNNYLKQLKKVNKIHAYIKNSRKDFLHKLSTEIANQYDCICAETLDLKAIANKKRNLGKSTYNNGFGMFLTMLAYKLEERGGYLIKVDKFFPSTKTCSCCGRLKPLELNERTYTCECGNVIDRDINAAINIKREGLKLLNKLLKEAT